MIPPISGAIGPLGPSEWTIGGVGPAGASDPAAALAGSDPTVGAGGGFQSALTGAISSLEQTQAAGTQAAQQLATGQLSDPTQAISAVENASLAMDLAAQIRTKVVDATQSLFQTQI